MEFKGTKGEWKVKNILGYPRFEKLPYVTTENHINICDVKGGNLEEVEANAKLIGSAPELLEALQDAQPYINGLANLAGVETLKNKIEQAIDKALK